MHCCGLVGKLDFFGMSLIIGPKGEVLAEAGDTPATIGAALDVAEMVRWREQITCFQDRKPQYY